MLAEGSESPWLASWRWLLPLAVGAGALVLALGIVRRPPAVITPVPGLPRAPREPQASPHPVGVASAPGPAAAAGSKPPRGVPALRAEREPQLLVAAAEREAFERFVAMRARWRVELRASRTVVLDVRRIDDIAIAPIDLQPLTAGE